MIGGNLSRHLNDWNSITNNKTVLNWIKEGIPLEFDSEPMAPFLSEMHQH